MERSKLAKAGILTLTVVLAFILFWEIYWRNKGFIISYNDDEALWAAERSDVYEPAHQVNVFIGASRIKFDIDLDTWEKETGEKAVQLAMVGTSARLPLKNLADDENFKGKLIIGVTERLFFSPPSQRFDRRAIDNIEYYSKLTPSQSASFVLNQALESELVFLEKRTFSTGALLDELQIPSRPGVFVTPVFPKEFVVNTLKRQTYMTDLFLNDTTLINRQKQNWIKMGGLTTQIGIQGDSLQAFLHEIKESVDKIRARGGQVLFVRPPSTGPMREAEKQSYPRELFWDRLLTYTNTPGIHFEDYPDLAGFDCPEWSHLSPTDAVIFTRHLINILQQDQHQSFFKHNPSTTAISSR